MARGRERDWGVRAALRLRRSASCALAEVAAMGCRLRRVRFSGDGGSSTAAALALAVALAVAARLAARAMMAGGLGSKRGEKGRARNGGDCGAVGVARRGVRPACCG